MAARVEVELIRQEKTWPGDPGAFQRQFAVIGMKGAVAFMYMDISPDCPPESRAVFEQVSRTLRRPLMPLWADIGYHAMQPRFDGQTEMDCDLMLTGRCYYDGSSMGAMRVGEQWDHQGRDPEWLYAYLADYYHDTFYGAEEEQ